jgi:hypothetical protein
MSLMLLCSLECTQQHRLWPNFYFRYLANGWTFFDMKSKIFYILCDHSYFYVSIFASKNILLNVKPIITLVPPQNVFLLGSDFPKVGTELKWSWNVFYFEAPKSWKNFVLFLTNMDTTQTNAIMYLMLLRYAIFVLNTK